ncbi:hypothetical protein [Mangrovitalea sediminis]|uniref:hypothetical protein n=1 Tax=Mangrovitalea sediminis TaxID=1982043 RepID=UPI000BE622CE|nr:hypothetical protein [Mangrovitalea sediminis]
MPRIFFSRTLCSPRDLIGDDPDSLIAFSEANNIGMGGLLRPGQAFSLDYDNPQTVAIVSKINNLPEQERRTLAQSTNLMGNELHGLFAFFDQNLSDKQIATMNSLVGATTGAVGNRLNAFQKAVVAYQKTLLELRAVQKATGAKAGQLRAKAEAQARSTFAYLRKAFQTELSRFAPVSLRYKNRGNALSNAERGITLASRRPNAKADPELFVADAVQASRLGEFTRFLGWLGSLGVVVDAGLRAKHVYSTYETGGKWLRDSSMQLAGFGFGGAAGAMVGRAAMSGATAYAVDVGLITAGPVAWIALAVIVGAGLVIGYEAGSLGDTFGKNISAWLWDKDK